jgi:hypothetical protein
MGRRLSISSSPAPDAEQLTGDPPWGSGGSQVSEVEAIPYLLTVFSAGLEALTRRSERGAACDTGWFSHVPMLCLRHKK